MKNLKNVIQPKPLILIGAMKAGTTTLFNYLKVHPEICPCIDKEPEYFSEKFGKPELKKKAFFDLFPIEPHHKYCFEASTGYTKYPAEIGVPERIKKYGINPKFIYLVRNPLDRIQSHYSFMQPDLNWKNKKTDIHLINTSSYYLQLSQYLEYFPKENFFLVDFEDLRTNPQRTCQKIFDFLQLQPANFQIPKKIHANQTRDFNRKAKRTKLFLEKIPLPYRLNKFFRKNIDLIFPPNQKKLTPNEKAFIHFHLRDDMISFQKEFGMDVQKWGFS